MCVYMYIYICTYMPYDYMTEVYALFLKVDVLPLIH